MDVNLRSAILTGFFGMSIPVGGCWHVQDWPLLLEVGSWFPGGLFKLELFPVLLLLLVPISVFADLQLYFSFVPVLHSLINAFLLPKTRHLLVFSLSLVLKLLSHCKCIVSFSVLLVSLAITASALRTWMICSYLEVAQCFCFRFQRVFWLMYPATSRATSL